MPNTNINGLIGFNPSSGTARLFAAYENDIVNVATGTGYGLAINTTNNVEFEPFLDRVFFQNYTDRPLTYRTSTNLWSPEYVGRTMIAKYLKKFKSRLYLGYCAFPAGTAPLDAGSAAITFPSRVFHSDLFQGNTVTWGIEWGRNGKVVSATNIFDLDLPFAQDFQASNIKVGDPLFITSGSVSLSSDKPYLVTKVDSAHRLIVDRNFPVTASSLHYWVGSNWFDAAADDGDTLTGFGENSNRLLTLKLLSGFYYTGSQLLKRQGPGTSFNRSVINDKYGNTYFFHGSDPNVSGIYKDNGTGAVLISRGISPFIKGMSAANFLLVVAWAEGNELRWYLGNLTNSNYDISMTNAVATYNVDTGAWSVDPIADNITASSQWIVSSQQDSYIGTADSQVLKMNSGNSYNTAAIFSTLETKVYYPAGSEIICQHPWVQVIGRNLKGLRLKYKLWNHPTGVDQEWFPLGEMTDDKTEFPLPVNHRQSSGIQYKFDESGTVENDWYVEKISHFYKPDRSRLL